MSAYLTYEGRLEIEAGLKERRTFGEIGRQIGKDRTTVAKEVKRNAVDKKTGVPGYPYNACIHRKNCKKKNICGIECTRKSAYSCRLCSHCNTSRTDFKEEICTGLNKAPYVCNGCLEQDKCILRKRVYLTSDAQGKTEDSISNARSGILSSEEELLRLNSIISPLIENGQSVHQIYVNYKDELMCSEKTIYNYIDSGLFDVRNIDLPRKVKYRQRRKEKEFKVDRACRNGRTYEDFKKYMEKNPEVPLVQMDSVVGKKGGKVLLTVHFVDTSLMLAYIRDANTAKTVTDAFRELRKKNFNIEKDIKNKCFICDLDKDTCEKNNKNFKEHCEKEHFIWDYAYYMITLRMKDVQDLNAVNSRCKELISDKQIQWLPDADKGVDDNDEESEDNLEGGKISEEESQEENDNNEEDDEGDWEDIVVNDE